MTDSCLQFLDEEEELVADFAKLASEEWDLNGWGVNYNIVAVCGQPDSGKTTLTDALFGTQFSVLDIFEEQETTKGVWISTTADTKILAMDTEMVENAPEKDTWPDYQESCAFGDIFDYDVVALPSKIDAAAEFDAAVGKLRKRFIDRHSPSYLFRSDYWKAVSADRIVHHLISIRHSIRDHSYTFDCDAFSNKNVPMLDVEQRYSAERRDCLFEGQYRNHMDGFYDMAIHRAYNGFLEAIRAVQKEIEANGIKDEYLKKIIACQRRAMATFKAAVKHHQDDAYKSKCDELRTKYNEKITSLAHEQMPWNSTGLLMQLVVARTLQKQENTIQERVQQEVERRMKEMELAAAHTKVKLDEQGAEIERLKAKAVEKNEEISQQIARADGLATANNKKDKTISTLSVANSLLETANGQKDVAIAALETEAQVQDELREACERDVSKLRAIVDKQDVVIGELTLIVRGQEATIGKQRTAVDELENEIQAYRVVMDQQKATIKEQRTTVCQREESIRKQSSQIDKLIAQVAEKEAEIAKANKEALDLGAALAQLTLEKNNERVGRGWGPQPRSAFGSQQSRPGGAFGNWGA
ncbi:hypothetical protein THASP1DRAFT_33197 [Thamnocephalis sphaerospora]|uniref:Root hair defective 3 GTP-binding protein-domain-containing protein n=1 Tax=Thamnocephalis sphaerospora TaxID=78915 RepID=A0A4P9XH50_9FUNG|nr:hypothetical protein THASP1DRAFT_33197 [Thamnocephalis sphaerospora]|eukprot:RKP04983.1 hypothetical protein THASP1DRAFT_33197 [Thamnocephalis sphaerospora]